MAVKTKAAGILVGVIALLIGGVAFASGSKKPKKEKLPIDVEDNEEIEVVLPSEGEDGAGKGPAIVIDEDDVVQELDPLDPSEAPESPFDSEGETLAPPSDIPVTDPVEELLPIEDSPLTPTEVSEITDEAPVVPLAVAETTPEMDPYATVALARIMLARETAKDWKSDLQEEIKLWQSKVGLTQDGKFGIASASRMGLEVGVLPLVRYWPSGASSKSAALAIYKTKLGDTLDKLEGELPDTQPHIDSLVMSIGREKAVSFGVSSPPAQDTIAFVEDANEAIAEGGTLKGEKELSNA